ncbi:MAG: Ku protein [Cytophagales bacterium]|nr:Ku protein [Cytophaga sp.]
MWKGTIAFGLVNIPVRLFSASQGSSLDFDMLDSKDGSRVRYKRVNETTGKEVEWKKIVKGYNLKNKYVILTDKDFELASPKKSKTIDIENFVSLNEVPFMYFETPYYIEPDKSASKAYNLLMKALVKSKKAGLARFVLRSTENLSLIVPYEGILVLQKLRFAEEVRSAEEIEVTNETINPKELTMAMNLIDQYSGAFDISAYKNEYSAELLKLIKKKATGKAIKQPVMKVSHRADSSLLDQLKASLNGHPKAS